MVRRPATIRSATALLTAGALAAVVWLWVDHTREEAVASWLRDYAIVLRTTDPTAEFSDMQPLGSAIADARIVGVGEATHGTREHSRYKHRLLRYLVTQKGFRALAFESPWPTGLALNQFVLDGEGDAERLLRRAVFGVWHTDEVLQMVRWIREYNAAVPPDQRVEFVGIDHQLTRDAARIVARYFERVDPEFRAAKRVPLDLLQTKEMEGMYLHIVGSENRARDTAETRMISAAVRTIRTRLDLGTGSIHRRVKCGRIRSDPPTRDHPRPAGERL